MTDLLRHLALRVLGITRLGNDVRLLGEAVIALNRRVRNIEAHLGEHDITFTAQAETGGDA